MSSVMADEDNDDHSKNGFGGCDEESEAEIAAVDLGNVASKEDEEKKSEG